VGGGGYSEDDALKKFKLKGEKRVGGNLKSRKITLTEKSEGPEGTGFRGGIYLLRGGYMYEGAKGGRN